MGSDRKPLRRSRRLENHKEANVPNHLPSPQSEHCAQRSERKRKRTPNDTDDDRLAYAQSPRKRPHLHRDPSESSPTTAAHHLNTNEYGDCVDWEEYFGQWPPQLLLRKPSEEMMADPRKVKRSSSYSQSVRDGEFPVAWTRQHQEKMQEAGLIMTARQNRPPISDACAKLCKDLLEKSYPLPNEPGFQQGRFSDVLDRVQFRNEARVVRDITPIIVPSAELLHVDGHARLEDAAEAMCAEWSNCDTLCGPKPKPDFVVGVAASAFTDEDKYKLRLSHTSFSPNLFPESMYFPFLICEVKASDKPLDEAERQAMHSASIAVRAMIQLYRQVAATREVDRKILAFSIAHNHSTVKVHGHYASIEGDNNKVTYYRHQLHYHDFATDLNSGDWKKAYQITRAIYDQFLPQHLARIRYALSRLPSHSEVPFNSQVNLDGNANESVPSQSSAYQDGRFKKPSLPSTTMLQQENDKLRDQMLNLMREQQTESATRREQMDRQREQMDRQREQMERQREQMERQLAQQKEEAREQRESMEQQLAQQKEAAREQKESMEQHYREIIDLLKESRSR